MSEKDKCQACGGLGFRVAGISLMERCQHCTPASLAALARARAAVQAIKR